MTWLMDPDPLPIIHELDLQIMLAASPTRGAPDLPIREQEESNLS
jgi:hypothetical protein